ncbi:NAD+ kinase [Anaerovibrio lipolyticus DSM 3074]|uniref:NAD kinase n=1 Tax=Anaerovibrio lipolyticus DSM 3074 TaxID=1120997 RepID=A0A1M6D8Z3_9FIRM|nr:NAD(+)/NADH kinase [Anaerovibrio lipolyticus]MBO5589540.1 NAD(+)/NADH kinase [Anaerovibrio sp.]SHI69600.1 NAD+ kinase [Anaerovibrio lipolyticus DSM 3074]
MKTIAIYPNINKDESAQVMERIRSYFADKQDRVRIVMSRSIAEMFNCPEYGIDDLDNETIDLGLSIGGDGTLLGVCRKLYTRKIPACGINIGRVGFLTDIELTELESRLDNLLNGEYQVVERTVISGSVLSQGNRRMLGHAINDVVIGKGGLSRMLSLSMRIDDTMINDYKADGVIVSTATGSTAYSLSAGGPIVNPSVPALLITPICPHTLDARPMIIPDDEEVQIYIAAVHQDIQMTFDGQESFQLLPGDVVYIRKGKNPARIIKFGDKNYYDTLKSKLWGNSK